MYHTGKNNKIVGFTNGCYDILHVGHLKLFKYLKSQCDKVIVGIDSDARVKELKGPSRPFNNELDRKFMLEPLRYVDNVYVFNSGQELEQMVQLIKPDLMVVGADYRNKKVVGSEYAKK